MMSFLNQFRLFALISSSSCFRTAAQLMHHYFDLIYSLVILNKF